MHREDKIRELSGLCFRSWRSPKVQLDLHLRPKELENVLKRPEEMPRYPAPPKLDFSGRNPIIDERFIAGVDPRYGETFFWKKPALMHGTGYMPSYHTFRKTERAERAKAVFRIGTNSARLILTGTMPDGLQTAENEEKHIALGESSNAYGLTTIEWSLYDGDPAYYSVPLLFRYLDSLRRYHKTGKNIYPYVIGATEFEIEACTFFLKEMGFQVVFYDATCMVRCRKWRELRHRINWLQRHFKQVVVTNYCSFNLRFRKVSFVSPNWFKVPRQTGQLVRGSVATKDDVAEGSGLSIEALAHRSFLNVKRSFAEMKKQRLLADYLNEKLLEKKLVNRHALNQRR